MQDLAPALLAIGELFQAANTAINDERAKASVKVRATSEGSFEIDLALVQTLIETMKSFFDFAEENQGSIAAANDLVELILKAGTPMGVGFLFALKWLKGRRPDRHEEKDGGITLFLGDVSITTNKNVIRLIEDTAVREQAKKLVSILRQEGIDRIHAYYSGGEELVIDREDIPCFEIPNSEEELQNEERRMTLQIISLSFKDDNKWRFTDGAEPFNAPIEDVDFLKKIAEKKFPLQKTTIWYVYQAITTKRLKKERSIVRVIEHKPSLRQLPLM